MRLTEGGRLFLGRCAHIVNIYKSGLVFILTSRDHYFINAKMETAPQPFSPVKKMAQSNTPTIAAASLWLLHDRGSLIPNLLTHGGLAELITALDQQTVASDQTTHRSHESL